MIFDRFNKNKSFVFQEEADDIDANEIDDDVDENTELTTDAEYSPPYNEEECKAQYGEYVFARLSKDPAHKFRMETGIELIHREPTKEELERIYNNWQLMTDEQKKISDEKCMELFKMTNEEYYADLMKNAYTQEETDTPLPDGVESEGDDNTGVEFTQEGMFDAGFNNLRFKLAEALGGNYIVSNVMKAMGSNDNQFRVSLKDNGNVFANVVNTGNGVKVPGYFTGISLFYALDTLKEFFLSGKFVTEYFFEKRSRFSFIQESDEDEVEDNEDEDKDIGSEVEDDAEDKAVDSENEDDDTDDVEMPELEDDYDDMGAFGNHGGDDLPNNEYDNDDITLIDNLLADESEAVSDYFSAINETKLPMLKTLFADIGNEERFHQEQLLYARSIITGEKYTPRDGKVKEEYEELLKNGMDEESAMTTAIDKMGLLVLGDDDDDFDDDVEFVEESLQQQYLLLNVLLEAYEKNYELDVIQEALDSTATASKDITRIKGPFRLIKDALLFSVNSILKISRKVQAQTAKNKLANHHKSEWLKKNGVKGLFAKGIDLYFYNDKMNRYDLHAPVQYVNLLYRLTVDIGKTCGVQINRDAQRANINKPIQYRNIPNGLAIVKGSIMSKTKVVVNDNNREYLTNDFFGYSDDKMSHEVNYKKDDGSEAAIKESGNIFNRLSTLFTVIQEYANLSAEVLKQLENMEGDPSSVYFKNRKIYNDAVTGMKLISDSYAKMIAAATHDLREITKLDNGLLNLTRNRDFAEQTGGQFDGPDVRIEQSSARQMNTANTTVVNPKSKRKWKNK